MIKAEEALQALEKIGNMMTMNFLNVAERTHSKEEYLLAERFVQQHLTPTFDEVVKAWEVAGYELLTKENGALHVFYKNTIQPSETTFAFSLSGSETDGMVSTKTIFFIQELISINLTIRYLEGKKEKENGK